MRSWAFATSPHGLGLPESRSWELTPRETQALIDVYERTVMRWAIERSMFANAHFRGKDDVAFDPQDFLGGGDREKRLLEYQRSQMVAATANANLMAIKKGEVPEGLPEWAK